MPLRSLIVQVRPSSLMVARLSARDGTGVSDSSYSYRPLYRNCAASAVGTLSAAFDRPPETSPSMTMVIVCSPEAEADGAADAPVDAGGAADAPPDGAVLVVAPPHAATRMAAVARMPKSRFCINCPPNGWIPDVSRCSGRGRLSNAASLRVGVRAEPPNSNGDPRRAPATARSGSVRCRYYPQPPEGCQPGA
jgi:hypothetical protein